MKIEKDKPITQKELRRIAKHLKKNEIKPVNGFYIIPIK